MQVDTNWDDNSQRYVAVARPSRESRLPRFRWAMVLAMNAATSSDTTMSMTMVDGPRPRMAVSDEAGPISAAITCINGYLSRMADQRLLTHTRSIRRPLCRQSTHEELQRTAPIRLKILPFVQNKVKNRQ